MMQTADKIPCFFNNSPIGQILLEEWIVSTLPEDNRKKLKELCRTRWVKCHAMKHLRFSLICFCQFFVASRLVSTVHHQTGIGRHVRTLSRCYWLSQFSFNVALMPTQNILAYTKGLSVKLQGCYTDVVHAHREIETVKATIRGVRSKVDTFHSQVYEQVLILSRSIEVIETAPRQASTQQHWQNISSSNISDYYKRTLTIPLLDHLSFKLDSCFDAACSRNLIEFMQLLPSEVAKMTSQLRPEKFRAVLQLYGNVLPSVISFDVELDLWQNKWRGDSERATELDTPEKVFSSADHDYYPNICTLIVIVATLPITNCECEQFVSMLWLVKTGLRSTMTETNQTDEVVQEFVCSHPRRQLELTHYTIECFFYVL